LVIPSPCAGRQCVRLPMWSFRNLPFAFLLVFETKSWL
jgi:hypothetical protein